MGRNAAEDDTGPAPTGHTQFAYSRIRQAIVEGRHRPGTRLVEQRLATDLDLSRTPIREALKMLDAEGLVTIERNVGAIVRPLDRDAIVEIYELRARLESYAAGRAARLRDTHDVQALLAAASGFERVITVGTGGDGPAAAAYVREVSARNSEFHTAVLRAARSSRLEAMLGRTVDVPLVFQAFRRFDAAHLQRSNLFHHLIAEAIEAQRDDRAERLMIEHVEQGRDVIVRAIGEGDVDALFS
ncbi:MAG: GntR family transcriptional regulator [Ilumatobacteraceae bacterium]|jgi:DNA-binding GntR family transcriptional regulator